MEEKWIKIDEIEYSSRDLSQLYEKSFLKKENYNTQNLEDLLKDNVLLQELRNNEIPYKYKWKETEGKNKIYRVGAYIPHYYFIEILIPESYKFKYDNMLKNFKMKEQKDEFIGIEELENADDNNEYNPFKKIVKAFDVFLKGILLLAFCCIIYMIIQTALGN